MPLILCCTWRFNSWSNSGLQASFFLDLVCNLLCYLVFSRLKEIHNLSKQLSLGTLGTQPKILTCILQIANTAIHIHIATIDHDCVFHVQSNMASCLIGHILLPGSILEFIGSLSFSWEHFWSHLCFFLSIFNLSDLSTDFKKAVLH